MKLKLGKEKIALGAGAAIGVTQVIVMKEYVDKNYGPIPYLGGALPYPWGNWSTLGNIIIGGVALGITQATKLLKGKPQL